MSERERIVICGGPHTGKTTLGHRLASRNLMHTDDYIYLGWSQASRFFSDWMIANKGPWVVEGVAAVRALRKALTAVVKPCDRVIWCSKIYATHDKHQAAMAKGCATVWAEILQTLRVRGVTVEIKNYGGGS